uniref:Peptidase S26 domain-containing protein n=1 Tax=Skeletonema marinoi TaxID=267567 RepID=A0A7S2KXP4_9STRA|mmetsp:Transcript_18244/g.30910  ORF Transcript_18244/g.30910 Transcript_18244/m.30910 type:complete len:318 (+) Transcript_18244:67-1020(+)
MPPLQRLRTCSRPLSTLFTTGCRSVVANTTQPCSSSQPFSRAIIHHHLFSSKSAQTPVTNNYSTIKQQVHSLFQSVTLFLPRVVAFCGTIHVTTEYGFNTVSCEGPSMEPTIIDGSFTCVLIDKFSHRIFGLENNNDDDEQDSHDCSPTECCSDEQEFSNNDDNTTWLSLLKGVWEQHFASGLQRGDVIILHHPSKEATICKRIIGMPGDTIIRTDGGSRESNHRVKVSPGHLWIEGDNTLQSHDSRAYGDVPASLIIGKVVCRLWPLRDYASLGLDANGMEHWQRVRGRIGRGERPLPLKRNDGFEGSHVLKERNC